MNSAFPSLLAPALAALAGWMLSGSPVPMALTVFLVPVALFAGFFFGRRLRGPIWSWLPSLLLAGAGLWIELRLYRSGQALATRADLPEIYHLGIALLWSSAADRFIRPRDDDPLAGQIRTLLGLLGLLGGLLVLAASAGTVLYDFGPWEAHPVAALPFVIHVVQSCWPGLTLPRKTAFAALPAALLLTALVLGSIAATDRLRPLLHPETASTLDRLSELAPDIGGGGSSDDGASRHLPRDADLHFRHHILVRLRPHSPTLFRSWAKSPLYLRTSTLALFESDEVISPVRSGRWIYDLDDGSEDRLIPLHSPSGKPDPPATDTLHTLFCAREAADQLPLVADASGLIASAVYQFADDWYQLSPADEFPYIRYTSHAPVVPPAPLRSADLRRPRPGEAPGIYLQMPPSPLSARITALTREFDRERPLESIRDHLDRHASYTLRFETPDGSSPLREFLFGHRRGHCEHYAAATVLMLRSLGIPARVAYGYSGGISDAGQRLFAFRDSDFHAWAEVLTPANEWKIFDTTPFVPSAAARIPAAAALPSLAEAQFHDLSDFDPAGLAAAGGFSETVALLLSLLSRHFFLATAAAFALVAALGWILPARRSARGQSGRGDRPSARVAGPVPDYLRELEAAALPRGLRRRPGQTWREFLARLAEHTEPPPAAREALTYHYATAYAGRPRDAAVEAELLAALREWHQGS